VDVAVADRRAARQWQSKLPLPPATPPAMAPVLERCPPIGIGVAELEEEPRESLLVEYGEELEAGVEE
jgi:hypothetical protein